MANPLNGNARAILNWAAVVILGLCLAGISTILFKHESQLDELSHEPPVMYQKYVDSQLQSIQEDVKETKELVKALTVALNKHIQDTR